MRVGRAALDEEAIRLIEASNPDLQFDWTRILKGQADPEGAAAPAPERRSQRVERVRQGGRPTSERRADTRPAAESGPDAPPVPAIAAEPPAVIDEPLTAAHHRLGSEGLARLRARYAETMARITERVQDLDQQRQLKELAERLNPDAWVTDGDVSAGLESYESTFEALRGTIGNRRRNARPDPAGQE